MKKSHNVRIGSVLFYAVIMFISNYIASQASSGVTVILLKPIADKLPIALLAIFVFAIEILIGLSIPLIAVFFYFRSVTLTQYLPSEDKILWAKSCARLILPAEILRFLICQASLGHLSTSGYLAGFPTLLYENTYLLWTNRFEQVRHMLEYNFVDFIFYAVCYLLYLVVQLSLYMTVYRHFWLESQKDREDLIVHESN